MFSPALSHLGPLSPGLWEASARLLSLEQTLSFPQGWTLCVANLTQTSLGVQMMHCSIPEVSGLVAKITY